MVKIMTLKETIESCKIIAIVRGLDGEILEKTADALYEGGIRLMEITFDQTGKIPDEKTASNIRTLSNTFRGRMHIGAGTVMSAGQVMLAADAGAEYMISPDVSEEVIRKTKELGLVSIPGALTPTEIVTAYRYGADYVKLFPAGDLGLSYVKSVKAPLAHIPMMAVGGVNTANLRDFLNAGLAGVGISSGIVNQELIRNRDFAGLAKLAKEFTEQI